MRRDNIKQNRAKNKQVRKRREAQRKAIERRTSDSQPIHAGIYNKRDVKKKETRVHSAKVKRNRKKAVKRRSLKPYFVILAIAILILLISILTGNKKDDGTKHFYLNNERFTTKDPIKISLAQNSTAKVAILSMDDIKEYFDKNIRYNTETKEIITIGDTHVARTLLNDFGINLNGTDSAINVPTFEENGKIYLPLNDLSSVYGIEVFIPENDVVIVDNFHKEKKIVKVLPNTRLRRGKTIFSKTIARLSDQEDYVLVETLKGKLKVRTPDGLFGYIFEKNVKTVVEIRSDYTEGDKLNYNFIRNYRTSEDNFDKIERKEGNNAAIIDILDTSVKSKKLVLSEKYAHDSSAYKIFREKLSTTGIDTIAELNLEKYDLKKYFNDFKLRQEFTYNLLKILNRHNVQGLELLVNDNTDLELYENFVEELKPRLKERGLKLVINKDRIKSDKIKENIDYES